MGINEKLDLVELELFKEKMKVKILETALFDIKGESFPGSDIKRTAELALKESDAV